MSSTIVPMSESIRGTPSITTLGRVGHPTGLPPPASRPDVAVTKPGPPVVTPSLVRLPRLLRKSRIRPVR